MVFMPALIATDYQKSIVWYYVSFTFVNIVTDITPTNIGNKILLNSWISTE